MAVARQVSVWNAALPAAGDLLFSALTPGSRAAEATHCTSDAERASIDERRLRDCEAYKKILEERRALGWCTHCYKNHHIISASF